LAFAEVSANKAVVRKTEVTAVTPTFSITRF